MTVKAFIKSEQKKRDKTSEAQHVATPAAQAASTPVAAAPPSVENGLSAEPTYATPTEEQAVGGHDEAVPTIEVGMTFTQWIESVY